MKKILLIDDNEQDRVLYKRYLRRAVGPVEFAIEEAASGQDGVVLFQRWQPDCVLLDYNLLDTDGLTLLEELRQLVPPDTLCVVMITGGGSEQLAVRALNNGALDYLVKQHFDQELLCKTVIHAIEKNEWRQRVAQHHEELATVNAQLRESLAELTQARQQVQHSNRQLLAANAEVEARNQILRVTNQQLARTNADLDNFVYAASHDLRQPVNNLQGLFDELRRSATFHDPEESYVLQLVDESLRDLSSTINGLAAIVQETRQPGQQQVEAVPLREVVAEVLQTLRPQVLETEAEIHTDFEALPELPYVRSNLRTILLNLLTNALKYRHAARRPRVWLRSQAVAGQTVLEVRDNGLGIDLQRHGAELFKLFRRFHHQAGEGTGVGLFLVSRLVEGRGGRIEVESQPDEGTTFRLYL
ncbi:hybrid sensor histidine kinase/response regulator [Hymenobacter sp. HSC-4F20]|uniref:sensor histidine kinase n=1 Tax=Hymenobacter sp. HSC-4F20 TaxID=2864135 RepID=UPI001C7352D6|nr:hybrid sensor histidine kinase/response regulator [Hymenobacter sp. HSC-4F20]MBX0289630.1 hybrid sensor histidine kinase/response regulator [Hymenobacter sp. HSC-4F20]